MVSRPTSPSTRLSRVSVATIPCRPSWTVLDGAREASVSDGVERDGACVCMPVTLRPLPSTVNLDSVINMSTHLSASVAAQRLGVSRATLYAYVSRGLIRSRPARGRRAHEYAREDVERLA